LARESSPRQVFAFDLPAQRRRLFGRLARLCRYRPGRGWRAWADYATGGENAIHLPSPPVFCAIRLAALSPIGDPRWPGDWRSFAFADPRAAVGTCGARFGVVNLSSTRLAAPRRDIAGNRDPWVVLRGCEGPRSDAKVASDPGAPSHFSAPARQGAGAFSLRVTPSMIALDPAVCCGPA
jgi:hypothetical protein